MASSIILEQGVKPVQPHPIPSHPSFLCRTESHRTLFTKRERRCSCFSIPGWSPGQGYAFTSLLRRALQAPGPGLYYWNCVSVLATLNLNLTAFKCHTKIRQTRCKCFGILFSTQVLSKSIRFFFSCSSPNVAAVGFNIKSHPLKLVHAGSLGSHKLCWEKQQEGSVMLITQASLLQKHWIWTGATQSVPPKKTPQGKGAL